MKETISKFKWFWAWQDEKEESWLREMSQQGWHLISVKPFGYYTFKSGEKADYVYRLDYQINRKDTQNYLQLFHDAGWEHIEEMSGWQYFRKPVKAGELSEIYTDAESKATKYKRVMAFVVFLDIIMVTIFCAAVLRYDPYPWWIAIKMIYVIIMLLLTYGIIKLGLRIKNLERAGK